MTKNLNSIKRLFILLALFFTVNSMAQSTYVEVIYLKNGSKIKGMIIEFVPDVSYTIETSDGSLFVCKIEDIQKITKEKTEPSPASKSSSPAASSAFEKGYRGLVELGYGIKTGKYGLDVTNFNFVNGYQLTPNFFAGVGTGIKYFNESETTLIPLYADFKYAFMDKKVTPLVGFSAGFSFNPQNGFEGEGFLFNPSLGVQIKGNGNTRFNVSLNYQTQQMNFIVPEPGGAFLTNAIRFSESAGITLGFMF